MPKPSFRTHHRVLIASQTVLAITLLSVTAMRVNNFASADAWDMGGGMNSTPTNSADVLRVNDGTEGGGDKHLAIFRAPKDGTRNMWTWDQEKGWVLHTQEETYENGWAWTWSDGQWVWSRTNTDAPKGLRAAAPVEPLASSDSSIMSVDEPGCLASDGSWTTVRDECADNQLVKRAEAATDDIAASKLPDEVREAMQMAAPLSPSEETQVKAALIERFQGPADVARAQAIVHEASGDVVRKLSILKDSDALTDTERQYFIAKIVEAQSLLTDDEADSMAVADASVTRLHALVSDVQAFVKQHGISVTTSDAPTASSLFASAYRMLSALPPAFDILDAAGYSTENLRSMHAGTVSLAKAVSIRCSTQGKDCANVADVIDQLESIISTLNSMVAAASDAVLRADVQQAFDDALRN